MATNVVNQVGEQIVVAVNPDGTLIGSGGTSGTGSNTVTPFADTVIVSNSAPVTSPGVGATIATIAGANIPAGTYNVFVAVNVWGTTGSVDNANITMTIGAVSGRLANDATIYSSFQFTHTFPATTAITLTTVAAGTTGSVYGATIILSRVA